MGWISQLPWCCGVDKPTPTCCSLSESNCHLPVKLPVLRGKISQAPRAITMAHAPHLVPVPSTEMSRLWEVLVGDLSSFIDRITTQHPQTATSTPATTNITTTVPTAAATAMCYCYCRYLLFLQQQLLLLGIFYHYTTATMTNTNNNYHYYCNCKQTT